MGIIIFIGGVIVGIVITIIFNVRAKTYGIIRVDHNIESCFIEMASTDLADRKIKKAIFIIDHNANLTRHGNADISREEQSL